MGVELHDHEFYDEKCDGWKSKRRSDDDGNNADRPDEEYHDDDDEGLKRDSLSTMLLEQHRVYDTALQFLFSLPHLSTSSTAEEAGTIQEEKYKGKVNAAPAAKL